ncbi:hypothetical protein AB1Y20_002572 [Prymnesium parvum]|uniref:Uncharacterized protein n=1 Tax=Prymnesium parvum TaxID=97485 RepID=A0AB34J9N4_PRYPA
MVPSTPPPPPSPSPPPPLPAPPVPPLPPISPLHAVYKVDGCGTVYKQCAHVSDTASIRCCKKEESACYDSVCDDLVRSSSFSGHAVSLYEAMIECEAHGARLCTAAELEGGMCCGTGCGFDGRMVWSSDSCDLSPSPPPPLPPPPPSPIPPLPPISPLHAVYKVNGCGTVDKQCAHASDTASIRCCKKEESACYGSVCDDLVRSSSFSGHAVSLYEAIIECEAHGARLCTAAELEGVPPLPPISPLHAVYKVNGCGTVDKQCAHVSDTASIRCCEKEESACYDSVCDDLVRSGSFSGHAVSLYEAMIECEAHGARLCTSAELEGGMCCDSGCGFNGYMSATTEPTASTRTPTTAITVPPPPSIATACSSTTPISSLGSSFTTFTEPASLSPTSSSLRSSSAFTTALPAIASFASSSKSATFPPAL